MKSGILIIDELIKAFSDLPGVGKRSAQRIVYHLLNYDREKLVKLSKNILNLKDKIRFCKICFNFADTEICPICKDPKRDNTVICVIEKQEDILSLEKSEYRGTYHILGGVISPLDGIKPEHLHIEELINRINKDTKEIILALNPTSEGEATSAYISKRVKNKNIRITKLARGIPIGSGLDYVDVVTIQKALEGRNTF